MATEQDTNLWIIALSGVSTYLGKVVGIKDRVGITKEKLIEAFDAGDAVKMEDVSIIEVTMMPTQQGIARNVAAYPFVNTLAGAPVYLHLGAFQFLDDMQRVDRDRYKVMAKRASDMAVQLRAHDSGIALPGDTQPDGPGQRGT